MRHLTFIILASLIFVATSYLRHPATAVDSPVTPAKTSFNQLINTIPVIEPGVSTVLPGATWVPQTFNNCGPAATSMALQYFGYTVNQEETKAHLRTNADDKNVFIWEIADYLKNDYGIESKLLYNGDIPTLKKLIANGFYIMVEDWLHPNGDIGHVLIIRGFDDAKGVLIGDDSYLGVGVNYPYEQWENTQWKPFNREYLPLYTKDKEALLQKIIGEDWDQQRMYEKAIAKAETEIKENSSDMYAYFNLGASLFALNNFQKANEAFDKSKNLGWPKRMLWYQIQPIQTKNALGLYAEAIELANLALWANDSFTEAHVEKAIALKGLLK